MRSWVKLTGAVGLGLMATSAGAADHTDGPAVQMDDAADIADVYAWTVDNNNKLALIVTMKGEFSPSVQYVVHIGRTETETGALTQGPSAWTNIICEFAMSTSVQCWVDNGSGTPIDYVSGDASELMGLTGQNARLKLHAAEHADPFFFYLDGLKSARAYIQNTAAGTLDAVAPMGCPDNFNAPINGGPCLTQGVNVGGLIRGLLNGVYSNDSCAAGPASSDMTAVNNFETGNVWAISAEIDKTAIDGTGEYFTVYASTHEKGGQ